MAFRKWVNPSVSAGEKTLPQGCLGEGVCLARVLGKLRAPWVNP